jgi:hypothetical protein
MPLICPTCQVAFSDGGYFAWGCFRYFASTPLRRGSSRTAPSGRRSGEDVDQTHKHECADACRQDRARRASDPEQQESNAYAGKGQQFRSQGDRAALPPHTQRRPEARMGEQPVFEPWRRSCEARRGENEERRRREHRQECADKPEDDEGKAENKVNATHQPQPSCKSEVCRSSRAPHGHPIRTARPGSRRRRPSMSMAPQPENSYSAHDASASSEVVAGPKICLYWNRDSRHVAGLRACGAAAGLA